MIVRASKRSASRGVRGSGKRLPGDIRSSRSRTLVSAGPSGSGRRNISITCATVSQRASASPAGRPALADEKADVPHDAVADLTESREMDEEPLLEQRRQRAVQVGRLRKFPELLDQSGRRIRGTEKVGENAEPIGNLAPETMAARVLFRWLMSHATPHCAVPLRYRSGLASTLGVFRPGRNGGDPLANSPLDATATPNAHSPPAAGSWQTSDGPPPPRPSRAGSCPDRIMPS
jgi:hypothetical protein